MRRGRSPIVCGDDGVAKRVDGALQDERAHGIDAVHERHRETLRDHVKDARPHGAALAQDGERDGDAGERRVGAGAGKEVGAVLLPGRAQEVVAEPAGSERRKPQHRGEGEAPGHLGRGGGGVELRCGGNHEAGHGDVNDEVGDVLDGVVVEVVELAGNVAHGHDHEHANHLPMASKGETIRRSLLCEPFLGGPRALPNSGIVARGGGEMVEGR